MKKYEGIRELYTSVSPPVPRYSYIRSIEAASSTYDTPGRVGISSQVLRPVPSYGC